MSAKLPTSREHTGDRPTDAIQARISRLEQRANGCPFLVGQSVKSITFAAGVDQVISHGLGFRPNGVLVLRDYGANVCTGVGEATSQSGIDTTKQLRLRAPVACTVDLWVF